MGQVNSKTKHCKHPNGCLEDAIRQALKQVKYGLIMSSLLQCLKSLRAILKSTQQFKKSFTPDFFSIIIFLCSSTFALRIIKCLLRKIRDKDDGLNSFLAGCSAGYIGILTLNKNYWYILLMFIASRIIGAFYQYLVQQKYLDNNNKKWHIYFMFVFANYVNAYGYFIEPDIVKSDMYNLYERMSVLTPNQKKWHRSSLVYAQNKFKRKGYQFYDSVTQQKIDKLAQN